MNKYTILYHAATYRGTLVIWADDGETALAMAKARIRKQMSLPMYSDSYRIVSDDYQHSEDEDDE